MTSGEYFAGLRKSLEAYFEAIDYTVVYAEGDEGNGYKEVCQFPTMREFNSFNTEFEWDDIPGEGKEIAVCID